MSNLIFERQGDLINRMSQGRKERGFEIEGIAHAYARGGKESRGCWWRCRWFTVAGRKTEVG